jgi:hypothetical protein
VLRLQTKNERATKKQTMKRETQITTKQTTKMTKAKNKQPKEQEHLKQKKTNLISQLTIYPVDLKF